MIVTSVQIKTAKTQKHLYCPVFTKIGKFLKRLADLLFLSINYVGECQKLFHI